MSRFRLRREQWLPIAAGACLALLLLDRLVLAPLFAGWQTRDEEIARLRANLAQGQVVVSQEARWLRWRDESVARLLPAAAGEAESQLLNLVDTQARAARLTLTSLRPRWKEAKGGERLLELQVAANGSMQAIANFLHSLETAPVGIAVEQLELAAGRDRDLTLDLRLTGLCQPANAGRTP